MKILIPPMGQEMQDRLRAAAPGVQIVAANDDADALEKIADADAACQFVTPEFIRAGRKLRWVQVISAGVENYLFPELVESDIVLTNCKVIYGIQLAEHTMALILSFSRAVNILIRRQMEEIWESRANLPATEIRGQTLGIVGLGGTGLELARRAHAFDLRILAVDPTQTHRPEHVEQLWHPDRLHDLLGESDFVALCCPLTRRTKGMIGDAELRAMKSTAYLINVVRGGVVDQEALTRALQAKEIAGAGIDVTTPEPLPKGNPLWSMDNVILTPHMAGQSPYAGSRFRDLFCENVRRFAAGEPLLNVVDKRLEY